MAGAVVQGEEALRKCTLWWTKTSKCHGIFENGNVSMTSCSNVLFIPHAKTGDFTMNGLS